MDLQVSIATLEMLQFKLYLRLKVHKINIKLILASSCYNINQKVPY